MTESDLEAFLAKLPRLDMTWPDDIREKWMTLASDLDIALRKRRRDGVTIDERKEMWARLLGGIMAEFARDGFQHVTEAEDEALLVLKRYAKRDIESRLRADLPEPTR